MPPIVKNSTRLMPLLGKRVIFIAMALSVAGCVVDPYPPGAPEYAAPYSSCCYSYDEFDTPYYYRAEVFDGDRGGHVFPAGHGGGHFDGGHAGRGGGRDGR